MNLEGVIDRIFTILLGAEEDIKERLEPSQLTNAKWTKFYNARFEELFPYMNLEVAGTVRNQTEPIQTSMRIKIDITLGAEEPMGLKSRKLIPTKVQDDIPLLKKSNYWSVDIRLPPQNSFGGGDGHCFYMCLMVPRALLLSHVHVNAEPSSKRKKTMSPPAEGVVVAWLYQIMINPVDHSQIMPAACLGPNVPNYQWGTLFMKLFDTICKSVANGVNLDNVGVIQPKVLAGLVDDAFLVHCGHHVNFSDMRRFQGQAPWYETYGFRMANLQEYVNALQFDKYHLANASVDATYQEYLQASSDCANAVMPNEERAQFCRDAPDCQSRSTRREVGLYIADAIKNNNEQQGCFWISDKAPKTCLTRFNRIYNPQTWHLPDEMVSLRLKFYSK